MYDNINRDINIKNGQIYKLKYPYGKFNSKYILIQYVTPYGVFLSLDKDIDGHDFMFMWYTSPMEYDLIPLSEHEINKLKLKWL